MSGRSLSFVKYFGRWYSNKTGWGPNREYKRGKMFVGVVRHPLVYYAVFDKKPEEHYGLQGYNHLLPAKGKVYDRKPVKFLMLKDKKYAWCSCGFSHNQPFCDGSHNRESTDCRPVRYIPEKDEERWFCNCKQTSNRPFCDGTHSKLSTTSVLPSS
ncbi:unnamed protein product [Soboliphyme baturini]|uniref:CDGSH iron-sulfur domain-containing protein 3, mitochondrial n=1 Tax=Soboliphyme baturini TaxID=241478 RepID=A0A183IB74_9BILA|nr:unnamed protein product [Soboliphyme baturini]